MSSKLNSGAMVTVHGSYRDKFNTDWYFVNTDKKGKFNWMFVEQGKEKERGQIERGTPVQYLAMRLGWDVRRQERCD